MLNQSKHLAFAFFFVVIFFFSVTFDPAIKSLFRSYSIKCISLAKNMLIPYMRWYTNLKNSIIIIPKCTCMQESDK